MAFRIATNVASLNTQRWLSVANAGMAKSLERLSSGYKINRAADDAAGVAIATKLNVKAVSVSRAVDNGNQAIAMLQTAESGIEQIANILTRLKELATQAASDNVSDTDREALDNERTELEAEIDKIAQNTKYGSVQLLTGSYAVSVSSEGSKLSTTSAGIQEYDVSSAIGAGTYTLNVTVAYSSTVSATVAKMSLEYVGTGTTITEVKYALVPTADGEYKTVNFGELGVVFKINKNLQADISSDNTIVVASQGTLQFQLGDVDQDYDQISVSLSDFRTSGILNLVNGDISTRSGAEDYLGKVDSAINELNEKRGVIGAAQNKIGYHVANLEAMYENTRSAVSTIKDADFAKEMAEFTKYQIITQSGIAMLAQANQLPQLILSLMR